MDAFDVSDLPAPDLRSNADWVRFWKRVYNAVSMGHEVKIGEWQNKSLDASAALRQLQIWEARDRDEQSRAAGHRRAPIHPWSTHP